MLNSFEKVKVIRPLLNQDRRLDQNRIPVMTRITENDIDLEKLIPVNIQNVSCKNDNAEKIALLFSYDRQLIKYWNDPFKYLPLVLSLGAICTPDYSVYSSMDYHMIEHSVYMNRWLGCLWQDFGAIAIPTIQWATPDTYDLCFSGVEYGTIVAISTLGCFQYKNTFLEGFNEMKKRINPQIIILFGEIIPGMTGKFVNYNYKDGFNIKMSYNQQTLFDIPRIFEIKGDDINGK